MIDIHCHILPAIDDGPRDLGTSLAMAEKLVQLGYTGVCATPHVPWGTACAEAGELKRLCKDLERSLRKEGIALILAQGAEHHSLVVPELLRDNRLVCYPRGDSFLMEFPLTGFPPRLEEVLFMAQVKGKVPVIAHLERYPEVQRDPSVVRPLKQRGCYLLVNLTSLAGAWGRQAQDSARELVRKQLVDAATSDLHSLEEAELVAEGQEAIWEMLGAEGARQMMEIIPAKIVGLGLGLGNGQ